MATLIRPDELKPCDVLLYHGNSWLSRMIRLFDGGDYSHASIWDGTHVVEALGEGIVSNSLVDSVSGAKYVDIFRFRNGAGKDFESGLPRIPVTQRISYYKANRQRYAYEQLLLLAMVTRLRPPAGETSPLLLRMLRNVIEFGLERIQELINQGKQPVICSELVYRCYKEAGAEYEILIRGADIASTVMAALNQPLPVEQAVAKYELERAGDALIDQWRLARAQANQPLANITASAAPARKKAKRKAARGDDLLTAPDRADLVPIADATIEAAADFVTPRDLQYSPNLIFSGTLRL